MTNHYLVTISFDGTNYQGWQIQKESQPTIQREVNRALSLIFKTDIKSIGAGRTDAGVHAKKFLLKCSTPFFIQCDALCAALNTKLPSDIRSLKIEETTENFHPLIDVKWREYEYNFHLFNIESPFSRLYISKAPYGVDISKIEEIIPLFLGEKDFKNFYTVGSEVSSTVRNIHSISFERQTYSVVDFEFFTIKVRASGFMKQMVRLIIGAIWEYARGKITREYLSEMLEGASRKRLYPVVPAKGLYKVNVGL